MQRIYRIFFFSACWRSSPSAMCWLRPLPLRTMRASLARLAPAAGGGDFSTQASIGGPFELTDQHGRPVSEKMLLGHYSLVTFGYTFCPDVCPTTLQTMTEAINRLGAPGYDLVPVFITVDPERDTVPVLADYASHFPSAPRSADRQRKARSTRRSEPIKSMPPFIKRMRMTGIIW